ncbi:peptidase C1A, papain [Psychromonas ingrahamii 37]|uniref:Peptidase C1A, papain n=1 Tax=Psychromonas ingrahamii (strain DSM 17664 / CCUG 51855 / 37) TaxID=357804 RepID=A1SVF0_PSYIN|nr:C1 family peptidase [Psychromonas ingrahamii]ABM03465.1 peptidase C1A, papain [Psychromonas ingrahamii 37]
MAQGKLTVTDIAAAIKKEGLSWQAGETDISMLPAAERKNYLGLNVTKAELTQMANAVKKQAAEETQAFKVGSGYGAPTAMDWRNVSGKNYITSVKNQGGCGSCVSFGTCATIESNMRIKAQDHTLALDLSEAFMQFCGGGSCGGWGLTSGLDYAKSTGVTDEACFPYQPKNMPCTDRCSDWQSRLVKILNYASHSSMQARKDAIAKGPVVAGMAVFTDFYNYAGGVYRKSSAANNELEGYHCVSVVGYDDNQQCWIIKNSWGPGWGENGFIRIAYNQADLLIDTGWAFYSVDTDVQPAKGSGAAKYLLVDKRFGGNVVFWAYAGDQWRYKVISDADLAGFPQEAFAANRVDIYWDKDQITLVRPWKNL